MIQARCEGWNLEYTACFLAFVFSKQVLLSQQQLESDSTASFQKLKELEKECVERCKAVAKLLAPNDRCKVRTSRDTRQ